MMTGKKDSISVTLCADDFGIAPGVNFAILELLKARRISATSCMTLCRSWREYGVLLKDFEMDADIGLHFTLTDFEPLGPMPGFAPTGKLPSFRKVFELAATGALMQPAMQAEIRAELERQLDFFESLLGFAPAHIDGHQHVHQLKGIVDSVLSVMQAREHSRPYLRICTDSVGNLLRRQSAVKSLLISMSGQRARKMAQSGNVQINNGFSGIYDFSSQVPYSHLFRQFLGETRDGGLILCHPGIVDDELRRVDSLTSPREFEFLYFLSDSFIRDLAEANVQLAPARRTAKQRLQEATDPRSGIEDIQLHNTKVDDKTRRISQQLGNVSGKSKG